MALVQCANLQLCYTKKRILKDVSFSIEPGEFIALIGPNGAGKTSLLRVLQAELSATEGSVYFQEKNVATYSRLELAKHIAVVSQLPEALQQLTVYDVAAFGLIPHKTLWQRTDACDAKLIENALEQVGLEGKQTQLFSTLSGGEQQRALLARALVQKPKLLLLDEPTNHLDPYFQHQFLGLCKRLGMSVLASIHDLNLAALYGDRLLLLHQGTLVASGSPEQVLKAPLLEQVYQTRCIIDHEPFSKKPRVTFAPAYIECASHKKESGA